MQGSWSSGLHMATVGHKLHQRNLSGLLLGLIPELPLGHFQGQILSGVNQKHPAVLPERHLVREGGTAKGLPKWLWGGLQGQGRWRETIKVHLPLLPLWPGVLLPVTNISLLSSLLSPEDPLHHPPSLAVAFCCP